MAWLLPSGVLACFAVALLLGVPATAQTRSLAPEAAIRSEAREVGRTLVRSRSDAALQNLVRRVETESPHGNIMELLFLVFRASIEATNEDKKYFLTKLKMYNDMGEALSEYLSQLVDASRDLGTQTGSSGGGKQGCGADDVNETTTRLDAAVAAVEAQIAKLPPEARSSADVKALTRSLRRDRQLIALARREMLAAAARPAVQQAPRTAPPAPNAANPKLRVQPIPQPRLRVSPDERDTHRRAPSPAPDADRD